MNLIPMMCVTVLLIGCGNQEPDISLSCQNAFSHREAVKDIKPISVADASRKESIMEDAAFCDKHPQGIP